VFLAVVLAKRENRNFGDLSSLWWWLMRVCAWPFGHWQGLKASVVPAIAVSSPNCVVFEV
jgi:hypothetical protein